MAAARSTLLEGLEGMSEEEQLRRVLELSEREAGAGEAEAGGSFENWVNTPASERLRALEEPGRPGAEIYYSDDEEQLRRAMELSLSPSRVMTDEEATKLAIEASERETESGPSSVASIDQELESALKLSLRYHMSDGARIRHNSVADPEPCSQAVSALVSPPPDLLRSRPLTPSGSGKPRSRSLSPSEPSPTRRQRRRTGEDHIDIQEHHPGLTEPTGPAFPALPMSEEQQLELALRKSAEQTSMSEDEQLKLALRISQSENSGIEGSNPPYRSDPIGGASIRNTNSASQPLPSFDPFIAQTQIRPSSGPGDTRHLGARSRVQQPHPRSRPQRPIRDVSSSSSSNSNSNPSTLERHSPPSSTKTSQDNLRMIVLDGSNISQKFGNGQDFVIEGLMIVYNWFSDRGHDVVIILPQSRKSKLMGAKRWADVEKLDNLEKANILYYSPSKKTDERSWDCYDDRFIIEFAARKKAIVVSNDNYRDVLKECNPEFSEQIKTRYFKVISFHYVHVFNIKDTAVFVHPWRVHATR